MKWFVKDAVKYIPGVGWGMVFIGCLFVKRNWDRDRTSIKKIFHKLTEDRVPFWIIIFAEGTRFSPDKLEQSRTIAEEKSLPLTHHVLLPRPKGFVASVEGLRDVHLDAVYDVTIGYLEGVPSLWQYLKGYTRVAHLHVRRYPTADLPATREELTDWLFERYREKDRLLEAFGRDGVFPSSTAPEASL